MSGGQPFAIMPIRLRDADVIVTWLASLEDLTMFGGPGLPWPLTPEAFLATASEGWQIFVLVKDDRPVATGSLSVRAGAVARIGRMLVDPRVRGQGWGRRMMEGLIQRAHELPGVARLVLAVFEQNLPARALYESLGFSEFGEPLPATVEGHSWKGIQLDRPL